MAAAFTQAEIIAFKKSMRHAGMTVRTSDGKQVTYPSLETMQATLAHMEANVDGGGRRRRHRVQLINIRSEGS